jgi:hypothetical protein
MAKDIAFDEPVVLRPSDEPVRTVGQAVQIVQSHLRIQFTIDRLTTLLTLERAAEGSEIAEARHAFSSWACKELATAFRA